jgi:hypothetical protein
MAVKTHRAGFRRAALAALAALCLAAPGIHALYAAGADRSGPADRAGLAAPDTATGAAAAAVPQTEPRFGRSNVGKVHAYLAEASHEPDPRDYFFALIGDIQNGVRNFRRHIFESIAADMLRATDEKSGLPLYDRIKFVILLGDLVYEGPSPKQWDSLERAFAGRDPDGAGYPNIKRLAEDKPIFPALGNHELFRFTLRRQTRFKDYCSSESGVWNFKRFFQWDRFIADPHILYPVPADLGREEFRDALARLPAAEDRELLIRSYKARPDGRLALGFLAQPPLEPAEFERRAASLAPALSAVFRRAGYGTLPVISTDNMIHYAFEAGGVLYVMLDSMARGWHYANFSRLKETLYPAIDDRHRLNLFTKSPFNGQAAFYQAAAAYAHERGLTLVPMMHHSAFNNSKPPTAPGTPFNMWLALGLPLGPDEPGVETIFDDILFSDAGHTFSACVHGYETFEVVTRKPGAAEHTLRWTISGGGGGPMRVRYYDSRLENLVELYNRRLEGLADGAGRRSLEIRDHTTLVGHEYLIVHVRDGRIVEIRPRFIGPAETIKPPQRPTWTLNAGLSTGPASAGLNLDFNPGVWGMDKTFDGLTFVNWKPSASAGAVAYDLAGSGRSVFAFSLAPLKLEFHIPGSNIVTLEPAGLEVWAGSGGRRRAFIRTGFEIPLVYNISGKLERLNFGFKFYFPFGTGGDDPDFGRRTRFAFSLGYSFRL